MRKSKKRTALKVTAMLTALLMAAALTACAGSSSAGNTGADSEGQQDAQTAGQQGSKENTDPSATAGNALIAYFSYTGNTQEIAQQIADQTGGTLVEIQRSTPYDDVNTEGEEELESNARPEITVNLDSIEEYDTIFIGYPIWWDEAPMVISTFLESYDFTGKTIVPFCTSASDSIDNSLHIFGELAPDAVIAEGLTANNEDDITPWLNSLGY